MENQYLREAKPHLNNWNSYKERPELVKKQSWAIPDSNAISEIKKYSPIIELGAGTGYWASLISETGCKIICFDKYIDNNPYKHSIHHYPVYPGDETILNKFSPKMNLFLSWPPYNDPFAYNAILNFRGKYLIYIGEGGYGCTGDEKFHNELGKNWDRIKIIDIPQWYGINDYLSIWRRK